MKRPHRFFIKRKPNRLNRVENPPNPGSCPWGPSFAASTARGFFFSLSNLKFTTDEIRTQDLLRARRYRTGLANRPPGLSQANAIYVSRIIACMDDDEFAYYIFSSLNRSKKTMECESRLCLIRKLALAARFLMHDDTNKPWVWRFLVE